MADMTLQRLAIVGVGLMGGSLGMALRKQGGWQVRGLARREHTLRVARTRGAIDVGSTDPAQVLPGADIVVFCSPVDKIVSLARAYRRFFSPNALLMDVGSVKGPLVRPLGKLFDGRDRPVFVGAHPMAGSEKTGVENARANLYQGAVCALTPTSRTPPRRVVQAADFWESVGARSLVIDPDAHDHAVALVSHLPHLIADALMLSAGEWTKAHGGTLLKKLAAGSFRDATRVAGADPHLWRGIFHMNDRAVRRALRLFSKNLTQLSRRQWSLGDLRRAQTLNALFKEKA
ncbi:MAG: prephenate dehydrogenase [Elusimicrobia bacterium]|nr:prephenate dehydrogenase [Elusimicrobiota bacterium]